MPPPGVEDRPPTPSYGSVVGGGGGGGLRYAGRRPLAPSARSMTEGTRMAPRPDTPPSEAPTVGLPSAGGARVRALAGRALRRCCPYCGGGGIFRGWFALKDQCPTCHVSYEREEGYFLGAYALNLIVAEILGLGLAIYLIFATPISDWNLLWQEAIAVALAVGFPLLFFPYSRTTWIALDLLVDPPGSTPERRLRGHEMGRPADPGDRDAPRR